MQQINLYLPEFQPNREPLRSIHMLWGLVAFLILLALLAVYSVNSNKKLQLQLEQDRLQLERLNVQLKQLNDQRPNIDLVALDQEILTLTEDLNRRTQIFGIVANKNLGNNSGFSEHIKALGRQSIDTLSLEVFSLQRGGTYVEFAGKTTAADQIPLYIQRLRTEPVFAQVGFGVLAVTSASKVGGALEFSLAQNYKKEGDEKEQKTAVQMLLETNDNAKGNN